MKAFVLDTDKTPLSPCDAARARKLLDKGKAAIYRRCPFTIILKRKVDRPKPKPLRFKLDPGSKISGMAIIDDSTGDVVWCAELEHRGQQIKNDLESRRRLRRGRRGRKTRYRPPRFLNRYTPKGWLPPSLMSRVYNIKTMLRRLRSVCNIAAISVENVRFDTQKMENPEISGVEYQQGELHGYEVREYLLEKFKRTCVCCGVRDVPMGVEVIGSNGKRIANGQFRVNQQELATAYRLVEIEYNPVPDLTRLLQNYPNPFNRETWIPYELSQDSEVRVSIYDVGGQLVRSMEVGFQPAGIYTSRQKTIYWNGKNQGGERVASGVYFYSIEI